MGRHHHAYDDEFKDDGALAAHLAKGAVAGVLAGLAASLVMNQFQSAWSKAEEKLKPEDGSEGGSGEGDSEPATEKAADKLAKATTGRTLPQEKRKPAGNLVHYGTGALLGGIYGVIAEVAPQVTTGFGAVYGTAVNFILDDAVVPALGLGPSPFKTSPKTHAYGLASHSVFGVALEVVRRAARGAI